MYWKVIVLVEIIEQDQPPFEAFPLLKITLEIKCFEKKMRITASEIILANSLGKLKCMCIKMYQDIWTKWSSNPSYWCPFKNISTYEFIEYYHSNKKTY